MLPAKNRLNLKYFKRAAGSKKVGSEDFLIIASKKPDSFKLGISISKKVVKKAVDRNRIKRLIAEALRGQNIFRGELAIFVKSNLSNLKMDELKGKLFELIRKI